MQFTIEEQIAEGDKVATRWTVTGTHKGDYRGISPDGKVGTNTGITIHRIAGGKMVESWVNSDDLGMLQQLGVVSMPEQKE